MAMSMHIFDKKLSWFAVLAIFLLNSSAFGSDVVGKPAPSLGVTDLQHRPVNLAKLHGQTVLLMFWATWCGPCRKEMPMVQAAYEKFQGKGFTVIAVNVSDDREDVERYTKKLGVSFPVVLDPEGNIAERFGVIGLPTNYIIDSTGTVRKQIIGGGLDRDHLEEILHKYSTGINGQSQVIFATKNPQAS